MPAISNNAASTSRAPRAIAIAATIIALLAPGLQPAQASDRILLDKDVDFSDANSTSLDLHNKDCVLRPENKIPVAMQIDGYNQITIDGSATDEANLLQRLPLPGNCAEKNAKVAVVYINADYCASYDKVAKTMAMIKDAGYQLSVVQPETQPHRQAPNFGCAPR